MRNIDVVEVGLDFGKGPIRGGRLALDEQNVGVFEHDPAFARSPLRINRFFSTEELVRAREPSFYDRLHGVFADSLPDAWGRLIMRRRLALDRIDYGALSPLQKLALVGTRGLGALVYTPQIELPGSIPDIPDIDELARASLNILTTTARNEAIVQLERLGGSSGGTRPKILVFMNSVGHITTHSDTGYEPWMIKFRFADDFLDAGPLEVAYSQMARLAGITMADTRLVRASGGYGYFATRRFDRGPNGERYHVVSAAGMFDQRWDIPTTYSQLLNITFAAVRKHDAVEEVFRRMVFNVLANNRDDHLRQHAFIMDEHGVWTLAPAFDLTYSRGPAGQHYLAVNDKGSAIEIDDIRAVAKKHAIKHVDDIIEEVSSGVRRFADISIDCGVSDETRALVETQIHQRFQEASLSFP
jgi:serine/threonine-protein kinase HipA